MSCRRSTRCRTAARRRMARRRGRMAGRGTGTSRRPSRQTTFVLGEFPWQIRVGDTTTGSDYVAPPLMLSAEVDADKEVTWSLGRYVGGDEIWTSLSLPGRPPAPVGIFANQPSPFRGVHRAACGGTRRCSSRSPRCSGSPTWPARAASRRSRRTIVFDSRTAQDASLVTPVFELDGRPTAVEIETATNLDNQWMFVGYALVNDETGQAFEVARDVSYYHGVEDGESWTEGSPTDTVALPSVPAGRYFLRIETEGDRTASPMRVSRAGRARRVDIAVVHRRAGADCRAADSGVVARVEVRASPVAGKRSRVSGIVGGQRG